MSDDIQHDLDAIAERCDGENLPVLAYQLRRAADYIDDLETTIAELRSLLETATDAWLDGAQLWHDSKLYADYRQASLPKAWYAQARKAVERE